MISLVNCQFNKRLFQGGLHLGRSPNFLELFRRCASGCQPAEARNPCETKPKKDPCQSGPPKNPCQTGPPKDPCQTGSKCSGSKGGGGGAPSRHTITFKPYVKPCYKDHDADNMAKNRPMSPHLTIYAPTMPAMTSIVQRITGIILTFYAFSISAGTLFLSNGVDSIVSMIQSLDFSRTMLLVLKLVLGFPFAYHYFFGIRFVAWNAGKWLDMKQVYGTAKQMGVAALCVTILFALM